MKTQIRIAFYTARALLNNRIVEWKNTRLEKKRRPWVAHRIDGGGIVPLGKVSQETAISKVSQYGSIAFVDTEVAVVMYRDKS